MTNGAVKLMQAKRDLACGVQLKPSRLSVGPKEEAMRWERADECKYTPSIGAAVQAFLGSLVFVRQ